VFCFNIINTEHCPWNPIKDHRILERFDRRMLIGLQNNFNPFRIASCRNGQPAMFTEWDVVFFFKAKSLGLKIQGFGLVVDRNARNNNLHIVPIYASSANS